MSIKSPFKDTISTSFLSPFVEEDLDVDAFRYIRSVEAADGQSLEIGVRRAISDFVSGCKSDGTWNAIKASCILAGARTLAGALVPLAGTAPTNFNFVAGDYNRKTGLKGNASTKYLDSNRTENADPQNSCHLSVFLQSPVLGVQSYIGDSGRTGIYTNIQRARNTTTQGAALSPGFIGVNRSQSSFYTVRAGKQITQFDVASLGTEEQNIHVFSRNNPASRLFSNARLAFYSIGEALDLAKLDARVTDLINAFGAAIP